MALWPTRFTRCGFSRRSVIFKDVCVTGYRRTGCYKGGSVAEWLACWTCTSVLCLFTAESKATAGAIKDDRGGSGKNIQIENENANRAADPRHIRRSQCTSDRLCKCDHAARNVRRILASGVNAPLPPEANKILKI